VTPFIWRLFSYFVQRTHKIYRLLHPLVRTRDKNVTHSCSDKNVTHSCSDKNVTHSCSDKNVTHSCSDKNVTQACSDVECVKVISVTHQTEMFTKCAGKVKFVFMKTFANVTKATITNSHK